MGELQRTSDTKNSEQRELRRDAAANRDRVLAAAAAAVRREGAGVPLATIAADAGLGVGTLYRRYPSREVLLAALTLRSFRLVLDAAQNAADGTGSGIDALRGFIDQTIEHGPELVLPMHGGPVPLDEDTVALRSEVHATLEKVLRRGRPRRFHPGRRHGLRHHRLWRSLGPAAPTRSGLDVSSPETGKDLLRRVGQRGADTTPEALETELGYPWPQRSYEHHAKLLAPQRSGCPSTLGSRASPALRPLARRRGTSRQARRGLGL